MTSPDANLSLSLPERRAALVQAFQDCRVQTLALFDGMSDSEFREQIDPGYSPLGWHLGHIAYTEAHWLVHKCGGRQLPFPDLERTFHVDGLPKSARGNIPDQDGVRAYARDIRDELLECLETADLDAQERQWRFVLQHECQHAETVSLLLACRDLGGSGFASGPGSKIAPSDIDDIWLEIDGGPVTIGNGTTWALDNEGPEFQVTLAPFRIAPQPVTQAQFAAFMVDQGYRRAELWTDEGWAWRSAEAVVAPLYWSEDAPDSPVAGVSAHEADAFAVWAGRRLPTEFEWEAAAAEAGTGEESFLGQVWQWTSSVFAPYSDFSPWPYAGYSEAYFDGKHRVLRGGSHATLPWALRGTFRNWYTPDTRQLIAGFRLAAD